MASAAHGTELVAFPPPVGARPPLTRMERRRAAREPWGAATPWIIAAGTLVLRLLTAATGPTDWDSAQYAAAVGHFDVTHGQPQPPGYWLYVMAGRLIHQLSGLGTIHSLVLVAALASAAAAGLTTLAGRDLGGPWVGLAAGLIVATCPFAWFSGSIVATYSFDMVGCSLLVILAWRARPGSWHGVAAVVALGLLAGFRQSMVQSFAVLTIIPVVASTRRWGRLALTVVAGAVAVGVWLVPMSLSQPGGFSAWLRATRIEAQGAAQATSVLDHAAAGAANVGTFAAFTTVALAPLALVALVAGAALGFRRLARGGEGPGARGAGPVGPGVRPGEAARWRRPWYQGRTAVLGAAIVPPMLLVALVQFAKGGYLLAYLPAAVIALLLPVGALNRPRPEPRPAAGSGAGHHLAGRRRRRRRRRPTLPVRGRGVARARRGDVGRVVARPAPLSGPLRRYAAGHRGRRRPATPPWATSGPRSTPAATWWCSTPSTAARTSTGTRAGRCRATVSP